MFTIQEPFWEYLAGSSFTELRRSPVIESASQTTSRKTSWRGLECTLLGTQQGRTLNSDLSTSQNVVLRENLIYKGSTLTKICNIMTKRPSSLYTEPHQRRLPETHMNIVNKQAALFSTTTTTIHQPLLNHQPPPPTTVRLPTSTTTMWQRHITSQRTNNNDGRRRLGTSTDVPRRPDSDDASRRHCPNECR